MTDIQKALLLQSEGKLKEAKEIYLEFLKENPKQPDVSNLLGLVYLQENNLEQAQNYFEIATQGFPCAEYHQNLGIVHYKQKNYEIAMQNFDIALDFENKNLQLARDFAQMAKLAKQTNYAIKFFEKALTLEQKDEVGLNNIGLLYEEKHDFEKAKECYIKSLKITKNHPALHNLGVLHRTLRNFDESTKVLHQALKLKPNDNETMISLGMSYLSKKDLQNGYKYYQFLKPEIKAKYKNHWDGKKHPDSTLFVFYYAGYGDHLMFSRYLPLLKNYFKTVKVWLPKTISILIEKNIDGIEFVNTDNVDYDYSANIMELHYLLNIDFENIPSAQGYLKADSTLIEKYNKEFFQTDKKKIGLFWQGNPKVFANRSIKLKELKPLFELEANGYKFYSFEKEDTSDQISEFTNLTDLGTTFKNFDDTAAALKNLDLLITIDSAIAHLAGALGVKTFLMLPYSSEWRWFTDTKTTPWYESVSIFKQEKPYDWGTVVKEIYKEIKKFKLTT